MLSDGARCTSTEPDAPACRQHPEPEMGCCSARACKVLPNTSRPSIVLRGAQCACACMAAASTWPPAAAWGLPACGQKMFPELDSMTITLPHGMGMPIFSTEQLPHGPSEAMAQVSCCMRPAGAPNALASTKRAQQQGRWISRPARRCLLRLRAMQCADAGPRACPLRAALMCMCRHGCSKHRASAAAWGLPACGQRAVPELHSITITLPHGMGMPIFSTEQLPHGASEAMAQVLCCMCRAGAPNALASTK